MAGNKRILITIVGSNDPFSPRDSGDLDGPILTLLKFESFNKIYLLYTGADSSYLHRAQHLREEINCRGIPGVVSLVALNITDPTDYESLYLVMHDAGRSIIENQSEKLDVSVLLSSGTPQMQTCWLLLVQSGQLPAQMLQVIPPEKSASGEGAVKRITLSLDRFPEIRSPQQVKRLLNVAMSRIEALEAEREGLIREQKRRLIGNAPAFRDVLNRAKKVAAFDINVLITGETGTGKEELARYIHYNSHVKEEPFLPLNCAAIPESLIESELFGHRKGAFTGAVENKKGLMETVGKGTLFLDEIGDLPIGLQAKLLRGLSERKFRPLGVSKEQEFKGRVVAATNRDLNRMIEENHFREDLYFRLNGITLHIPALKDRKQDIPLLVTRFLQEFNERHGRDARLKKECIKYFMGCPWRGNIRELKQTIERLIILSDHDEIDLSELKDLMSIHPHPQISPSRIHLDYKPVQMSSILEKLEIDMIKQALEFHQGNRAAAARHLGMNPHAFRAKLKRMNLDS